MNPGDIPKMGITTPFSLFKFTRMTFGMQNSSNIFQPLMDCVLARVACAFTYLDNIFSRGEEEFRAPLIVVLQHLQGASLAANNERCEFVKSEPGLSGPPHCCQGHQTASRAGPGHHGPPCSDQHEGSVELPGSDELLLEVHPRSSPLSEVLKGQ